ncbi:MAG: 50S ribosomal protein L23 [bacterium]|nr:50S ribosomal protein L23 [bacterium]
MTSLWSRKGQTPTDDRGASPRPVAAAAPVTSAARTTPRRKSTGHAVLIRPHLTEKSSVLAERGRYTFLVTADAEKTSIARAVAERYGVHPTRVGIVHLPGKEVRYGRTVGRRSVVRKAIVTLRSGESIPFGVKS